MPQTSATGTNASTSSSQIRPTLLRTLRLPALFCAFAVLLCELISRPYAAMGICDDPAYIFSAHTLAMTGHIVYVGAAAAMLGAQLYIGAAFIKLFGFSFTVVRLGTLLVAMATAFLTHRTMVRSGISERNATIGTLTLAVSPLFLVLSMTFMSDMYGLFAVVICMYCCLRALQSASTDRTVAWLFAAVATNAIFGTARQIAWLGLLVMVPCTLWLLRRQPRALVLGASFTVAGAVFVFVTMRWFHMQPYALGLPTGANHKPLAHTLSELIHTFLDAPFLLLPIMAMFLPQVRKNRPRTNIVISVIASAYILLAFHWRHSHPDFLIEPTQGDWVTVVGGFQNLTNNGLPQRFLPPGLQILLTVISVGGLVCLAASLVRPSCPPSAPKSCTIPGRQLWILLGPFTLANMVLLVPSAANALFDRYLPILLVVFAICLVRYYQECIQQRMPISSVLLVTAMAVYGIVINHNMFSFYNARVQMAAEIRAAGVPDTSVDNGWEYNFQVELQHATHINDPGIVTPKDAYSPAPPLPPGTCPANSLDHTPHIRPIYGVSYSPDACYGPAPFAPVHYSRWLARSPGTLYVVRYLPSPRP